MRGRFERRAAIEAVISHLKHDFCLLRCFLKASWVINQIDASGCRLELSQMDAELASFCSDFLQLLLPLPTTSHIRFVEMSFSGKMTS